MMLKRRYCQVCARSCFPHQVRRMPRTGSLALMAQTDCQVRAAAPVLSLRGRGLEEVVFRAPMDSEGQAVVAAALAAVSKDL